MNADTSRGRENPAGKSHGLLRYGAVTAMRSAGAELAARSVRCDELLVAQTVGRRAVTVYRQFKEESGAHVLPSRLKPDLPLQMQMEFTLSKTLFTTMKFSNMSYIVHVHNAAGYPETQTRTAYHCSS